MPKEPSGGPPKKAKTGSMLIAHSFGSAIRASRQIELAVAARRRCSKKKKIEQASSGK